MATELVTQSDSFVTLEVFDANRHESVLLEGLRKSATVGEVLARATAALRADDEIDWHLRDQSGRLLRESQRLADIAQVSTHVELTLQPDAGLG